MPSFHGRVLPLAAALALVAACGGSDDGATTTTTTTTAAGARPSTTTTAAPALLRILVTNDDGVGADGIDALVTALGTLPSAEVTVVAPARNNSGTGGRTTDGPLTARDATTKSGYRAKAVDGFPADTIRFALDDLGLKPQVVVSGINAGQNLGPSADISGTIGAARAAVARGIPALAVSQGLGPTFDYQAAVPLVLDWVKQRRAALAAGDAPVEVDNMNVPSCAAGDVRGLKTTGAQLDAPLGDAVKPQDCTSTANPTGDVAAFSAGFATLTAPLPI